jgi:hypothetical protein
MPLLLSFKLKMYCTVHLLIRGISFVPPFYDQAQGDCKWRQMPALGNWNLWDDVPVTQYFQSGAFFFTAHGEKEDDQDLFKVPQFPAKPYNYKKVRQSHHLFF